MVQRHKSMAMTLLKGSSFAGIGDEVRLDEVLSQLIEDKGYDENTIHHLGHRGDFGFLVARLLQRIGLDASRSKVLGVAGGQWNELARKVRLPVYRSGRIAAYRGLPRQNLEIDQMLSLASVGEKFFGEGAATELQSLSGLSTLFQDVPIAVIGYGAAGIMVADALSTIGFRNITVFEKRAPLGIWAQPNVNLGSRNNPRHVSYLGRYVLEAAPGNGGEVKNFLASIYRNREFEKVEISRVEPGDLRHVLHFGEVKREYPIVINTIGLGDPVPFSDPKRMRGPAEGSVVAMRWQNPQLTQGDVEGKRFIFVGLGNSTAEMIRQLHEFEDLGVDVDYRIFTHFPQDAVHNPRVTVHVNGNSYRVFRDMSRPDLTGYQGDLSDSRADYYRALHRGRIVAGVKKWNVKGNVFGFHNDENAAQVAGEIDFQQLCVLTGYRHSVDTVAKMGCSYDAGNQYVRHDYDGELIASPAGLGGQRVHKGYFGFGAILDAPHNRNSSVLPGMVFRLPDLLFGVMMRAGEYTERQKNI